MLKNKLLFALFTSCLLTQISVAKPVSSVRREFERHEAVVMPNTQVRRIYSQFTKQNYRIYVSIPASYHERPKKMYPALYTLDADYSFALAKQITEHLSDRNHIPEAFVFGIAYDGPLNYRVNRTRDYTPTYVKDGGYGAEFQKYSGGGAAFASFLEKELIPYLEKSFRISKQRALSGHSYGGLFASWLMVTKPQVFSGYIVVSPSLWYDDKVVFKHEEQSAVARKHSQVKAFFGVGSKETPKFGTTNDLVADQVSFVAALESRKFSHVRVSSHVFEEENHDTVFPAALTRGIMFVLNSQKGTK